MTHLSRIDQRRIFKLVTLEEASRRLQQALHTVRLDSEIVSVEKTRGRILAETTVSHSDIPLTKMSAVDGYAVRSSETQDASLKKPLKLKVKGELFPASTPGEFSLLPRCTAYLGCGAPVPDGADAVIRVEDTRRQGEELEVCRPIERNKNVILAGEDVKRGSTVLHEGRVLRPQDIGLLAALRIREVKIVRKPRVAVLSVGDELTELKSDEQSKTINNYALVVSAMALEFGAEAQVYGVVPDAVMKIAEKMEEALKANDIVVTIGGCSVGLKDFVPDAVNAIGNPGVIVHGIKISPGKVAGFGVVKGKPLVMLPGHIVSTVAGFYLFVAPIIGLFIGQDVLRPLRVNAKVSGKVKAKPGIKTFLRVHVHRIKGSLVAEPIHGGSSSLSTIVGPNGFTIVKEGTNINKGDEITVTLFSEQELLQLQRMC